MSVYGVATIGGLTTTIRGEVHVGLGYIAQIVTVEHIFTYAKEFMFLPVFVCLSVCLLAR